MGLAADESPKGAAIAATEFHFHAAKSPVLGEELEQTRAVGGTRIELLARDRIQLLEVVVSEQAQIRPLEQFHHGSSKTVPNTHYSGYRRCPQTIANKHEPFRATTVRECPQRFFSKPNV